MRVQAEISLYPLRTMELSPAINRFGNVLKGQGVTVVNGPMSTIIGGEAKDVFRALEKAFSGVAEDSEVVMTCKVSNACPEAPGGICKL